MQACECYFRGMGGRRKVPLYFSPSLLHFSPCLLCSGLMSVAFRSLMSEQKLKSCLGSKATFFANSCSNWSF